MSKINKRIKIVFQNHERKRRPMPVTVAYILGLLMLCTRKAYSLSVLLPPAFVGGSGLTA